LVLSPTRELAQQIADEAKVLLEYHRGLGVVTFYGGTKMSGDLRDLQQKSCDILVATPGRMQDHLDTTPNFATRMQGIFFLTLDEADQLLDHGFRDAILKIVNCLPRATHRQGALFSATFPAEVGNIARMALKPDHTWLDTVTDEVTPDKIAQSVAITDIEGMTELLWSAISSEMAREPRSHKIMVFFVAARVCQIYSEMFNGAGVEVLEIHSRKSQPHRTKAADQFRRCQHGIVFSSDVIARGMDFPDVTTVIQVGVPSSRDQYIHRLGRTGRAGKSGGCILLLHDFEQYFMKTISDMPLKKLPAVAFPNAGSAPDALWRQPDPKSGCQAYQAWLGYYNSAKGLGWKKDHLVEMAYRFAESISAITDQGLPPPIAKKTIGKMGLKGVPGLNLVNQLDFGD
jgi:ATP-dependent RNA helicase MSS116